jgi:hypothetical protein
MFTLAWIFLPDLPEYRTGLIIVGLARCIAMVIIWNDLACGHREAAAVLVALNSIFQVIAFSTLGWFYLAVLPGWLDLNQASLDVPVWDIARSVLIFLGIPLLAGFTTRRLREKAKSRTWYETKLIPRIGPLALYGLLFTIVVLFALQGQAITTQPADVARIALPLLAYFALMWTGAMALGKVIGMDYPRATTLAFTAAGNNFELAIAVAIATFGATSGQAPAGVGRPPHRSPRPRRAGLRRAVGTPLLSSPYTHGRTPDHPAGRHHPCLITSPLSPHHRCCSYASTTPVAPKWPRLSSLTSPMAASKSAPPAPPQHSPSTPPWCKQCARSASISPPKYPKCSPPTRSTTPT